MNDFEKNMEPYNILMVEDHIELSNMISKFLKGHNFAVDCVENGELALQKFDSKRPDIILMDIMLPGMSGIEATKRIREKKDNNEYIPILMVTAKNHIEDMVVGLNAGADDYIVKPFKFEELLARIKAAIRTKDLYDKLHRQTIDLEKANKKNYQLNQTLSKTNKELKKNIYDLHNIFEVSLELHSILDLDKLINSTLLSLIGQFSCKNALYMFIQKKNEQRLSVLNSKGFKQADIEDLKIEKSDPLFKYFEMNKDPILLSNLSDNLKRSPAIDAFKNINIELITPIFIHKKETALVCLGERVKAQGYSKNELEILATVNNIISVAVSNAYLYDEVIQLSYTDGMTDLHNYRYFELRLNEEIMRHRRTKQDVSLILLDVDYFKNYNDTLGHPAGDEVLRRLAHILKDTVRENDIVARYGGEEFAVILPNVGIKGALILAERVREKVEEYHFPNEEIQPTGNLTISLGTATLPKQANDAKDLIQKTDSALYMAKETGRNRVVQYTN